MEFDFYKIQSAGNDLILANFSDIVFPSDLELAKLAVNACRRDYGIGGNGFIAIKEISSETVEAFFINPLGDYPTTTIDAALCLSRYAFDS